MNPKRSMQRDRSIELFAVNDNDPPPRLQSAISFWWPLLATCVLPPLLAMAGVVALVYWSIRP
jgi:hypothetical protein